MRTQLLLFMDNLTVQDMAAIREMMGDHSGKWGQNTALYSIVVIIAIIAFLWFCRKAGDDKADLAASVQNLYGRVNALEPAVTRVAENVSDLNSVTSATTQAVGDFKKFTLRQLNDLDDAVFVPRTYGEYHHRSGCGCNDSRFIKKSVYTPSETSVEQFESCG